MRPFMRSVLAKVYVKHPHPIVYPILYIPGLIKYRWTNDRVIRSHCIEASLYIYALNIEDSTQYTHNNGKEQICNGSSCDRESGTGTAALDNIGWNKFRATDWVMMLESNPVMKLPNYLCRFILNVKVLSSSSLS